MNASRAVINLLKAVKSALGDGGMCSAMSCGWGSCDHHCGGWPKHKRSCVILKVSKFLETEGRTGQ